MSINYSLPKNKQETDSLINKAWQAIESSTKAVQIALVATIYHAYKHGDWTIANRFALECPKEAKQKFMVDWLVKFGGLVVGEVPQDNGQPITQFVGWKGKEFIKENFELAKDTLWTKAIKQEAGIVNFDLNEEARKFANKMGKKLKSIENLPTDRKGDVKIEVNEETIRMLLGLLNVNPSELVIEPTNAELADKLEQQLAS